MRFGICCGKDEALQMLEAGFDYVEVAAAPLAESPTLYSGIPLEATNVFFPGSVHLFGPDSTPYLPVASRIIEAAAAGGVTTMVIGSGASRKAPPETDLTWAHAKFVQIAAEISQFAANLGVTIAPESLSRNETNVGNDLRRLALDLDAAGIPFTADCYHVLQEWHDDYPGQQEPSEDLWEQQVPKTPAHVHFATLQGRGLPSEDDPLVLGFFRRLRQLGYDQRISFEGARGSSAPAQVLQRASDLWRDAG